jgi:nicotinate-nucleotide pyrophosphorylase
MELPDVRAAVRLVAEAGGGAVRTEASGSVGLEDIEALSRAGVDTVSVGRITHSTRAFDFTMLFQERAEDHG